MPEPSTGNPLLRYSTPNLHLFRARCSHFFPLVLDPFAFSTLRGVCWLELRQSFHSATPR